MRRQPRSTLFPTTTLSRSRRRVDLREVSIAEGQHQGAAVLRLERDRRSRVVVRAQVCELQVEPGLTADCRTEQFGDRKSTRLNSSHQIISYAVFCLITKPP